MKPGRPLIDLGLDRIKFALNQLGNPQNKLKIVHVAGTNGKGSVCAFLASVLGVRHSVGKFVSPHLLNVRDSITINGIPISSEDHGTLTRQVGNLSLIEEGQTLTNFEILTVVAFLYFNARDVDLAVIEVGLGGSLDATNVIDIPLICVITSIGFDHENILGRSLEQIASHKAGIIKPGVPVVVSPQPEAVMEVFRGYAVKNNSSLIPVQASTYHPQKEGYALSPDGMEYPLPLLGDFQLENSAVALRVFHILRSRGVQLSDEDICKGFKSTIWPGRCEWKHCNGFGRILIDGAHNVPASMYLRSFVDKNKDTKKVIWIIGMTCGKDIKGILQNLISDGDIIFSVPFSPPDQMPWIICYPPQEILDNLKGLQVGQGQENWKSFGSLSESLDFLKNFRSEDFFCVVTGSLYLMSEFYQVNGY
eukprot:TRINITY_DN4279_c0_g1_i2.p1 TRINITY_DN4279_c0_g1~~TRINITY_DN4279_c0_g1_i2.p1  ORF type:complete len:434 (+),score=53.07 TRINITY_DN4279_c0_g1_i2:42-1304(+)